MTRVLLVGGGAREHAIAEAIAKGGATLLAALPNKNPGILSLAKEHVVLKDTDAAGIARWARERAVDLAIVSPDAALAAGVTDALQEAGIACASPTKAAAEIEWNKQFMRDLLEKHEVPGRVGYRAFERYDEDGIRAAVESFGGNVAVKPVGLTGGKGVKVSGEHLHNADDALAYAREIFEGGQGGGRVIVEEKIDGEEFSLQAFCDGEHAVPMPAVQDHKRAFAGDTGPNTGGMGSYSGDDGLLPFLTREEYDEGVRILNAILAAMRKEGRPFVGTIYGQFMVSRTGPRVIEINARFGDPEAMNVFSLLSSNYVDILRGMTAGALDARKVRFLDRATVCKYVVPEGYGVKPMANEPLVVDERGIMESGAHVYYAAVNRTGGARGDKVEATTTTSRAVGIVATGDTIAHANQRVDRALAHVTGPHLFHREDIGTEPLLRKRVEKMRAVRGG